MGMYMYPIEVKKEPQKVRYHKEVELPDGLLKIENISKHIKEGEQFGFRTIESGMFSETLMMDIYGFRLETQEELDVRVAKEELYMKNYAEFQRNKANKNK